MTKLRIGIEAPHFVLDDFHGNPVDSADFRDKKHILLVFNRGFL